MEKKYRMRVDLAQANARDYKVYRSLKERWWRKHGGSAPSRKISNTGYWAHDYMLVGQDGSEIRPTSLIKEAHVKQLEAWTLHEQARSYSGPVSEDTVCRVACLMAAVVMSTERTILAYRVMRGDMTLKETGHKTTTMWDVVEKVRKKIKKLVLVENASTDETLVALDRVTALVRTLE